MEDRGLHDRELENLVRTVVERVVDASLANPGAVAARRVAIGADHGGFPLKEDLKRFLPTIGWEPVDLGTHSTEAVDYPDYAAAVARAVVEGRAEFGIMIDGAGIGSCMAANKIPGARAALCYDLSTARNSREHNHANVLTLGARLVGEGLALDIVGAWLSTVWGYGRHGARVDKITAIERRYAAPASEVPR
jgi:ribose 5-phosphate isomerase B